MKRFLLGIAAALALAGAAHAQGMSGGCATGQPCSVSSLSVASQTATYTVGPGGNFTTLNAAIQWVNSQVFLCCGVVTLQLQDGVINEVANTPDLIQTDSGVNLVIQGAHVYSHNVTSIQSSSGSAGAWTYVLNLDAVTNVAVGDYETIYGVSGGTNPTYIAGVWPVTAVDTVNKRVTITTTGLQTGAASGSVAATADDMKSILKFTNSDGIRAWNQTTVNLNNFVLLGDSTANHSGVSLQDRNRVWIANRLAMSGWGSDGVMSIYNSELNIDAGGVLAVSNSGTGIAAVDGGSITAPVLVATGNAGDGVYVFGGAVVHSNTTLTASGNGLYGVAAFNGSSVASDGVANTVGNVSAGMQLSSGASLNAVTLNTSNNGGSGLNTGDRGVAVVTTLNSSSNGSGDQVSFASSTGFTSVGGCLAIGYTACQSNPFFVAGNGSLYGTLFNLHNASPSTSYTGVYIDSNGQAQLVYRDGLNNSKWEMGHQGSGVSYDFRLYNDVLGAAALTINSASNNAAFGGPVKPGSVAVGGTNSCSVAGQRAWVTDASVAYGSSTRGGQITGSGSNGVPAYCDGAHWDFE